LARTVIQYGKINIKYIWLYGLFFLSLLKQKTIKMDEVTRAKEVLKNAGYFVDNFWTNGDVESLFSNVPKEVSQEVLKRALTNDDTMEHIWYVIESIGEDMGLKRIGIEEVIDMDNTCPMCGRHD
jgi:hypothetical protein